MKTVTMFMLLSGQRPQILKFLSLQNMEKKRNKFTFTVTQNLKHSREKTPATVVQLQAYPGDKRICIVNYLNAYLSRTEKLRNTQCLFITSTAPYEAATLATMSRWIKTTLELAGIDTTVFSPGSTRAASANAAQRAGVPIQTILSKAAWQNETTFNKWYKKPIVKVTQGQYQQAIQGQNKVKDSVESKKRPRH